MKECWVVFKHSTHWSQRFLKSGFGHCYVLTKDKYCWYTVDPRTHGLQMQILGCPVTDDVPRMLKNDGNTVVRVMSYDIRKHRLHFRFPCLVNCVTLVKYILGIKATAFTPYQLYKKLKSKTNFKNIWVSKVLL